MNRAGRLALICALSVASAALARDGAVRRIGYVSLQSPVSEQSRMEAFRQGLREHGFDEGKRVVVEYRHAGGSPARLPDLVSDLLRANVELIVAVGLPAIRAAHKVAPTTPIVFPLVGDPVRTGLVASLGRPGGTMTGLSSLTGELGRKRLAILKEAAPTVRRVAVVWNPENPVHPPSLDDLRLAAASLRLQLDLLEVKSPTAFERAFVEIAGAGADALFLLPDEMFHARRRQVADFASKHRLPAMYFASEWVEDGGLISYGAHIPDLFRRAAGPVARILQGAKPAELPVEQPTKFELVVNRKSARAIGMAIPQSILLRADRVIE